MSKKKTLAMRVAKFFILVMVMLSFFTAIHSQIRRKTHTAKPKIHRDLHRKAKVTLKKKKAVDKSPKIPPASSSVHEPSHPSEEEYITLLDIFNGGVLYYRNSSGDYLKMGWDLGTEFHIPRNKEKRLNIWGCFKMVYCKEHRIAYILKQAPCS